MLAMLLACPLGRTFVLQLSDKDAADPAVPVSSDQTNSRCQGAPLQTIRENILQGLNLKWEPRHQGTGMAELREQWKAAFKVSGHSGLPIQSPSHMSAGYEPGSPTAVQCCKLSTQIFIKDLGWENWVIYPESFTFTQCSPCSPQPNPSEPLCPRTASTTGTSSQVTCCHPVAHDLVPFLYLDDRSTLVISSVPMTSQCGCGGGGDPQPPQP